MEAIGSCCSIDNEIEDRRRSMIAVLNSFIFC